MNRMIHSQFDDTPPMREFNVSNHLLGDRAALDAAWDRDGYWFFRDVLDRDALARLRGRYMKVLRDLGVVDPAIENAAVYNGASLDGYSIMAGAAPGDDPLLAEYPADEFTADPAIKQFFTELFGEEPFWIPNTEFHALPPQTGREHTRFNYVHTDGSNNKGLPLRICWIPVADIDEATGGLALAEGLHKPRMDDFPRPPEGIGDDVVPEHAWRRAEYRPGDVLIFSLDAPHSGLANRSEKYFRLSMDIRCMPKSGNIPAVGHVAAINECAITLTKDDGEEETFRINEDTFARIYRQRLSGMPLKLDEIPQKIKVGDPVFVASDRGNAIFIRPRH